MNNDFNLRNIILFYTILTHVIQKTVIFLPFFISKSSFFKNELTRYDLFSLPVQAGFFKIFFDKYFFLIYFLLIGRVKSKKVQKIKEA